MAHLRKQRTVRWVDASGRRCARTAPGAVRVVAESRKWYAAGVPGWPKDRRQPLCADRSAAEARLAALVRAAERGEAGLDDSVTEARKKPLAGHLDDWERSLANKDTTAKTVATALARVRRVVAGCEWESLADLDAEEAEQFMAGARTLPKAEGGVGPRTSNYYLQALCQFGRWLCDARKPRLGHNPFLGWHRLDASVDVRRLRRRFTADELARLDAAAAASPRRAEGLTGPQRRLLYLAALGTGFRARELAETTPARLRLDLDPPAVELPRRLSKNRQGALQPLPGRLAAALADYAATRDPAAPLWPGSWWNKAAEMLRVDLDAAGIPYTVPGPDGPLYGDFHALRHSYISALSESGATPKEMQTLARHSDPRLTIGVYSHADAARLGEVVNRVQPGTPGGAAPTPEELATACLLLAAVVECLLSPPPETPP